MRGFSLIELLFVLAILATVCAMAIPQFTRAAERGRVRGAAFYLSSRVALLRMQAVHRSTNVALRFVLAGSDYTFQGFMDGDGDGVRSADIAAGTDQPLDDRRRLADLFRDVRFGFVSGCPFVDGSSVAAGADPVRIGSSRLLVFAPAGTATSGTLYLRGSLNLGYALVVLGATGRTRLLTCDPARAVWTLDDR
jgi:prepilin-type N-terminal cleavage/methylation domain-containing protein